MANYELTKAQIAALGIREHIQSKETLEGLAEIAAYMDCSIGKVRLCIKHRGLPATQNGSRYFTTKTLINRWVQEKHLTDIIVHQWDDPTRHKAIKHLLPETRAIPLTKRYLHEVATRFNILGKPNPFLERKLPDDPTTKRRQVSQSTQ